MQSEVREPNTNPITPYPPEASSRELVIPKYFTNRCEIEAWLSDVGKPTGASQDVEEWFVYAVYYQQKALEDGYIINVSYSIAEDGETVIVTCDVMTNDGNIYYFDPDIGTVEDTGLRVPLEKYDLDTLAKKWGIN